MKPISQMTQLELAAALAGVENRDIFLGLDLGQFVLDGFNGQVHGCFSVDSR
jgi:hypothetical protein